jgi:hypothetical protein
MSRTRGAAARLALAGLFGRSTGRRSPLASRQLAPQGHPPECSGGAARRGGLGFRPSCSVKVEALGLPKASQESRSAQVYKTEYVKVLLLWARAREWRCAWLPCSLLSVLMYLHVELWAGISNKPYDLYM